MQAAGREAGLGALDVRPPAGSDRAHVRADRARQRGRRPHRRRRGATGDLVDRRVARRAARDVRVLPLCDADGRGAAADGADPDAPAVGQPSVVAGRRAGRRSSRCAGRSTAAAPRSACRSIDSTLTHISDSRVIIAADPRPGAAGRRCAGERRQHRRDGVRRGARARTSTRRLSEPGSGADLRRLRQHGRVARAGISTAQAIAAARAARPWRAPCSGLGRARSSTSQQADDILTDRRPSLTAPCSLASPPSSTTAAPGRRRRRHRRACRR